jgi:hypothetical protein
MDCAATRGHVVLRLLAIQVPSAQEQMRDGHSFL